MRLINLIPLHEIDFPNQKSFDQYNKVHKLRPDTKVVVAGRVTTAGRASQNSPSPVKGTSVFGGDDKKSTGDKPKQKLVFPDAKKKTVEEPFEGGENVLDTVEKLLPPGTGFTDKKTSNKILVKGYKDNHMFVSHENHPNKILKWPLKQFFKLVSTKRFKFHPKPKDLESSVETHLNKVSGGKGYAQKDDGSGAIAYNMGDGDMPTYTLYMGKEGSKHRVSLEPTYGNDPKKLQGKIDKSFDKVQDAIKFMGDVAKKHRRELEMQDK